MILTLTLTKLTRAQWKKLGTVALWLLGSTFCSAALAFIAHNPKYFVTTAPLFNFGLMLVKQVCTKGEAQSISELPTVIQPEVANFAQELETNTAAIEQKIEPMLGLESQQN